MLNAAVLVRSPKLSNIGPGKYLDGRPPGNTRCCRLLFKAKVSLLLLYAKSYCCLKFGDVKKLSLIERGAKIFNGSNFGQNNRKPKNFFCSINFVYNQLLIGQKYWR